MISWFITFSPKISYLKCRLNADYTVIFYVDDVAYYVASLVVNIINDLNVA